MQDLWRRQILPEFSEPSIASPSTGEIPWPSLDDAIDPDFPRPKRFGE